MLNHFLMFADESSAVAALPAYGSQVDGAWQWDDSRVIPGQRVILARAVWSYADPEQPVLVTPEQAIPGYFLTISLDEIDEELRDLPDNVCRLIGDSKTGALVYTAPDLNPALIASAIIEPVPAGAAYLFGG